MYLVERDKVTVKDDSLVGQELEDEKSEDEKDSKVPARKFSAKKMSLQKTPAKVFPVRKSSKVLFSWSNHIGKQY